MEKEFKYFSTKSWLNTKDVSNVRNKGQKSCKTIENKYQNVRSKASWSIITSNASELTLQSKTRNLKNGFKKRSNEMLSIRDLL